MPSKSEITRRLIEVAGLSDQFDTETALKSWYQNIRPNGGLRLTTYGYKMFRSMHIESWTWPWPEQKGYVDKRLLLDMDRKMEYPYYIDPKKREIVFFSSREAMMATLYGDIKKWLENNG